MNPYHLALWSLAVALIFQSVASGLSIELFLRKEQAGGVRRAWLAIAIASLLLALHHGYTVELALRTGLYDMRQAVLAGLTAILFALGTYGLRRNAGT
jgi:cell shape-determining protein MreD